jgi:hypothetical protein
MVAASHMIRPKIETQFLKIEEDEEEEEEEIGRRIVVLTVDYFGATLTIS